MSMNNYAWVEEGQPGHKANVDVSWNAETNPHHTVMVTI